jgi:hypothetical protein
MLIKKQAQIDRLAQSQRSHSYVHACKNGFKHNSIQAPEALGSVLIPNGCQECVFTSCSGHGNLLCNVLRA